MALILHPQTEEQVAQFITQPVHAVLLVGSNGIGKTSVAQHMLANLLELAPESLASHPYFAVVSPDAKGTISIDAVRGLQRFLQLKTLGSKPLRRAVVLEHAECLTVEAQNAFLKLLEEPPADTMLVLTADNQRALLPTILSRVQSIPVIAPDEQQLKTYFASQNKQASAITQAYFLSGGLPGLMSALLDDDQAHPLTEAVTTAKEILQKQGLERLALIEPLSKQKDSARYTLQALQHIAQTGLNQAASKAESARLKQWHRILKVTAESLAALDQNANTKLVLTNALLNI